MAQRAVVEVVAVPALLTSSQRFELFRDLKLLLGHLIVDSLAPEQTAANLKTMLKMYLQLAGQPPTPEVEEYLASLWNLPNTVKSAVVET